MYRENKNLFYSKQCSSVYLVFLELKWRECATNFTLFIKFQTVTMVIEIYGHKYI